MSITAMRSLPVRAGEEEVIDLQTDNDLRTNVVLLDETQKQLDRGGLPMRWEGWCLTLAEAFDLNPRRVRRVLKRHGLGALQAGTRESHGRRSEG